METTRTSFDGHSGTMMGLHVLAKHLWHEMSVQCNSYRSAQVAHSTQHGAHKTHWQCSAPLATTLAYLLPPVPLPWPPPFATPLAP